MYQKVILSNKKASRPYKRAGPMIFLSTADMIVMNHTKPHLHIKRSKTFDTSDA